MKWDMDAHRLSRIYVDEDDTPSLCITLLLLLRGTSKVSEKEHGAIAIATYVQYIHDSSHASARGRNHARDHLADKTERQTDRYVINRHACCRSLDDRAHRVCEWHLRWMNGCQSRIAPGCVKKPGHLLALRLLITTTGDRVNEYKSIYFLDTMASNRGC